MRVAIISTSWPRSNGDPSGHFVRTEALQLSIHHEVTILAPDAPSERAFDVIPLVGGGAFGWPGALAKLRQNPLALGSAALWVKRARAVLSAAGPFDRVIAHWAIPSAWPISVREESLEIVSHGSDTRVIAHMPLALRRRVVFALAERARPWRFVSAALLERFLNSLSSDETMRVARVATIRPCAIEVPDVRSAARDKQREIGFPFVTAIGRLVPEKRTERILEVAANERMPIVVVGDGPERARLERLARHAVVKFTGQLPRHEALAWLGASQSLWFASKIEGLPTVVREAEALGIPVRHL